MKKIDWKAVGGTVKDVCGTAVCLTLIAGPYVLKAFTDLKIGYKPSTDYSDAIRTILKSNLFFVSLTYNIIMFSNKLVLMSVLS